MPRYTVLVASRPEHSMMPRLYILDLEEPDEVTAEEETRDRLEDLGHEVGNVLVLPYCTIKPEDHCSPGED